MFSYAMFCGSVINHCLNYELISPGNQFRPEGVISVPDWCIFIEWGLDCYFGVKIQEITMHKHTHLHCIDLKTDGL